ncbi:MAG: DUF262 domain-containing protein [Flavobacteriaceae bacterium]
MTELTDDQNKILKEVSSARKTIKTDDYSMSIGELINLYSENEIKLDPAFQRLFRWDNHQRTKLIESILIGIPIPEIFVAQKSDGTWHVVDGVQRLSTIFQLVGKLSGEEGLTLTTCKYIPSLEGKSWTDLPVSTQREFKKSKIKVNIILTENSDEAQYELFQRLNTGGTSLSPQEVRNCLMLMVDPGFYEKINKLKNYGNFKDCLKIKDHMFEKEFHMELILRMYIGYQGIVEYGKYKPITSVLFSDFIDKETINLIKNSDVEKFEMVFKKTFDKIKNGLKEKAFHKYDEERADFIGAFNVSAFEMISSGIASNIGTIEHISDEKLRKKIELIYAEDDVKKFLGRGKKALVRFKGLTEYAKGYFSEDV